jgi:hypothetical protein
MVFQTSIVYTLFITQLETTHKGGSNQIINCYIITLVTLFE